MSQCLTSFHWYTPLAVIPASFHFQHYSLQGLLYLHAQCLLRMHRIHPLVFDPFFLYSVYTYMSSLLSLRSLLPISHSLLVKQSCFSLVYRSTSSFLGFRNRDQELSHLSRTCSLILSLSTLVPVLLGNWTRPPTCQSTFLSSIFQFRRRYLVSRYRP